MVNQSFEYIIACKLFSNLDRGEDKRAGLHGVKLPDEVHRLRLEPRGDGGPPGVRPSPAPAQPGGGLTNDEGHGLGLPQS